MKSGTSNSGCAVRTRSLRSRRNSSQRFDARRSNMATSNTMKPIGQAAPVQPIQVRNENDRAPVIEVQSHEAPQWSDGRAEILADEKQLTADFFAEHEFLLPSDVLDLRSTEEST